MRIALGLEYRGTAYCGWQSQPTGCGVQDYVEKAITVFLGLSIRVVCAGRTDAGVHARAQVVHLDTEIDRAEQSWVRGVNAHLPSDIRVVWATKFADLPNQRDEDRFHARFSARARAYQYLLLNDAVAPGIDHMSVGWYHAPLDMASMQAATAHLLGEHDFSAFRSAECQAKTPIKLMHAASVRRQGPMLVFDFRASAFLHHMVRNIIGSLVCVGAGKKEPAWIAKVLAARDRGLCAPTFAADGLYLTDVEYDAAWSLPKFAARTVAEGKSWE
jgi:tRNA pseudouridine38-40 synthase